VSGQKCPCGWRLPKVAVTFEGNVPEMRFVISCQCPKCERVHSNDGFTRELGVGPSAEAVGAAVLSAHGKEPNS
jgi:hypothetical protein